ncbi:hypothetical protein GGU10DRAFT_380492 [Lentinula aff. detonsa]|uniref:BTB domain-containing protein n=1 Tax=Lentinula aff. detonsa TaxID=2804958 RepID=A0AA38NIY4_9AGAR|nr:hypothetical protein GGU10DRAFT_380492 [Lentinula aff. detonsa]
MVFRTGNVAMDIDGLYPSFSDRYCYMGFTQVLRVEQGDILVRSMDSYIFALDSDLVLGAAGCIPFNHEYSLIPGISDLRYDSATLSWIFTFLRREEVKPIEDLSFTQLIGIARAASEFGFHSIQTLCRLALRRFRNQNSQDILSLSVQYGYHALLPMLAATKLIDTPLTSLQDILRDPSIYRAWSLFRDQQSVQEKMLGIMERRERRELGMVEEEKEDEEDEDEDGEGEEDEEEKERNDEEKKRKEVREGKKRTD